MKNKIIAGATSDKWLGFTESEKEMILSKDKIHPGENLKNMGKRNCE